MKKTILLSLAVLFVVASGWGQAVTPFKDGDRAVFLGNSITDGGHYHSYIWLYYMTRFPEMKLTIENAGIGGDTALTMYNRLDTDVFNRNPTVLTVTFGMNDTGYAEYNDPGADEFGNNKYNETITNYGLLEGRLKGLPGTRVVLMGSSPYDEISPSAGGVYRGKNAVMKRVVEHQRASASANGWEFVDLNAPMTAISERMAATNIAFTLCGDDRIHPGNDGHMVMAYLYLKAQGFVGHPVADVAIDAGKARVIRAEGATIGDIRRSGRDLSFEYLASALPYPMDTLHCSRGSGPQADIVGIVPSFIEDMNREMLAVEGLKGNYELSIDGEVIGVWSGAQFASGINLAEQTWTPQYQQAQAVMYLNEYRWELERSFRELAWVEYNFFRPRGMLGQFDRASIEEMDRNLNDFWILMSKNRYATYLHPAVREARAAEMAGLIEQIYRINKPVARIVTLHKVN